MRMTPHIGIIFVYGDRLHIESTPVAAATPNGDLLTNRRATPTTRGSYSGVAWYPQTSKEVPGRVSPSRHATA